MTLEESNLTEESLMEVRDRTLVEAYDVHDTAESYLVHRLERAGYHVEPFGDDARHADEVFYGDGPDQRVRRDEDGAVLADIEVKSKRLAQGEEWFGRLNRRHYNEYVEHRETVDHPVFIYFALVDERDQVADSRSGSASRNNSSATNCEDDDADVIVREAFLPVTGEEVDGRVTDISEQVLSVDADDVQAPVAGSESLRVIEGSDVVGVGRGPLVDGIPNVKGNDVVEVDAKRFRSWMWLFDCLGQ